MANKRTYTRAQLKGVGEEIDPTATATALIAGTKDLTDVREIFQDTDYVISRMHRLREELDKEKRRRYGETFICAKCNNEQIVGHKMSGHYKPMNLYAVRSCSVNVCYECAMASPNFCPDCAQRIRHFTGGPGPHVIVRLLYVPNSNESLYRFEFDPTTTALRKIKEVMLPKIPAGHEFSSIHVGHNSKPKLAENLYALGVRSGPDEHGNAYITVNFK